MGSSGKKKWFIPDAYYPKDGAEGPYVSHEAICVLNTGKEDAELKITLYFEDREPLDGFEKICSAGRTNHIRLDQITNDQGKTVPRGVPYAIVVESSVEVVCQYSRLDTTKMQMSLMTTIAY